MGQDESEDESSAAVLGKTCNPANLGTAEKDTGEVAETPETDEGEGGYAFRFHLSGDDGVDAWVYGKILSLVRKLADDLSGLLLQGV